MVRSKVLNSLWRTAGNALQVRSKLYLRQSSQRSWQEDCKLGENTFKFNFHARSKSQTELVQSEPKRNFKFLQRSGLSLEPFARPLATPANAFEEHLQESCQHKTERVRGYTNGVYNALEVSPNSLPTFPNSFASSCKLLQAPASSCKYLQIVLATMSTNF